MLNRAVAVGHVSGAAAGLAETERVAAVLGDRQQWHAVRAYLFELGGEFAAAGDAYAAAAERATEVAERDHLIRRSARPGDRWPPDAAYWGASGLVPVSVFDACQR